MWLPSSVALKNLNYVFAIISGLRDATGWCSIHSVDETCRKKVFNAQIIDHADTIQLARRLGLVLVRDAHVSLTAQGEEFFALNPDRQAGITAAQRQFLAELAFFRGPFQSRTRSVFSQFIPDHDELTYRLTPGTDHPLPPSQLGGLHTFEFLGVIQRHNLQYSVSPAFVRHVRDIRAEPRGLTQEELELRLDAQRKLGFKAEEVVVDLEQRGLLNLGLLAEADRVKRISDLEPAAGFDIRSFSGNGPAADYDKFIEVKCSGEDAIRFYWTRNEMEVARSLGPRYWIYFLPSFKPSLGPDEVEPLCIQDPYGKIVQDQAFVCEPQVYRVTAKHPRGETTLNRPNP